MNKTNIHHVILFQVDQVNKAAKLYSQREFDRLELGITVDQWVLLKIIEENQGLSQKELAELSLRDPASITRTLDLLESKDLIRRQRSTSDRRNQQVALSNQGKAFVAQYMSMIKRHRKNSTKGFTPSELEQLSDMLHRMQSNMR